MNIFQYQETNSEFLKIIIIEALLADWYLIPLILLGGFAAGIINTLAGSGSVVTLAILSFLGLPTTVANGTNRIGVFFQCFAGYQTYKKHTEISLAKHKGMVIACVLGAILGTQLVVEMNEKTLNFLIGFLMIGLLGLVLFKPKKWLKEKSSSQRSWNKYISYLAFFSIGIYGGMIQAGVGIFLLAAMILGEGMTMNQSNGIKLLIVLFYTIPSLLLFVYYGQVNWLYGLLLAVGQTFGAILAATYATKYPKAPIYIRYLLIVILLISIYRFFRLAFVA